MSEPTFTSSTYRDRAPLNLDPDRPLSEQAEVQGFLNDDSSPVPEIVLYRLWTLIDVYLRAITKYELTLLYIGYRAIVEEEIKAYYIGWQKSGLEIKTFVELYNTVNTNDFSNHQKVKDLTDQIAVELEKRVLPGLVWIDAFIITLQSPKSLETLSSKNILRVNSSVHSICPKFPERDGLYETKDGWVPSDGHSDCTILT